MILLSTYMMAIWANCQWIFYRLRPYKNLVNEPLWPYRIAVNSLFCLMAIAYNCQWCDYWPQLCRNSVNEWLTAIREYCQRFSIVQGHTRQLSTYFLEKAVPELCQWNTMAAQYYCQCFLAFFYNFHNMPQSSRPYQRIVKKAIPDNCQLIFGINLNQNFVNIAVPDNCQLILDIKLNRNYSHKHCKHCFG